MKRNLTALGSEHSDDGNSESNSEESSQGSAGENESFDPDFRMESVNVSDLPHYK